MGSFQFERLHMAGTNTEKITCIFYCGKGKAVTLSNKGEISIYLAYPIFRLRGEGRADDDPVRCFCTPLG